MVKKGTSSFQFKGRMARAQEGFKQGGPAPYGYKMTGRTRDIKYSVMTIDQEEADIVRDIFKTYIELKSLRAVVRVLEDKFAKTRRKNSWSIAGLAYIIRNSVYIGECSFGKIRVSGKHEPIIDKETFKVAQEVIGRKGKRSRRNDENSKRRKSHKSDRKHSHRAKNT